MSEAAESMSSIDGCGGRGTEHRYVRDVERMQRAAAEAASIGQAA
jgi:hypothetical protein